MYDDDSQLVLADGLGVRRRRHDQGWSHRDLVTAIGDASVAATGVRETLTPSLLTGIEERGERIPYSILCLVAGGLDCDPVDILAPDQDPGEDTQDGGLAAAGEDTQDGGLAAAGEDTQDGGLAATTREDAS